MRRATILVLIILLLLAGCVKQGNTTPVTQTQFFGTEAVSIGFIPNAPPDDIYQGQPFTISVVVENIGSSDIEGGSMSLGGFSTEAFQFESLQQPLELLGRSPFRPQGDKDMVTFSGKNICIAGIGSGGEKQVKVEEHFIVKSCFAYRTEAAADVCIQPPIISQITDSVCTAKAVGLSGGQGGPVGVTRITPSVVPSNDQYTAFFDIEIARVGKGRVQAPSAANNDCKITENDANKVKVNAVVSNQHLSCEPQIVTLDKSGKAKFRCSMPLAQGKEAYTTPVQVTMEYAYSFELSKKVNVNALLSGDTNTAFCVAS